MRRVGLFVIPSRQQKINRRPGLLRQLIRDPRPTLPLLRALQDDPSPYVRRSVANHLNDIAKDHPAIVADWLDEHLPGANAQRRQLLRHASRTLLKRGDRRVLSAWGLGQPLAGTARLRLSAADRARPEIFDEHRAVLPMPGRR